jgi:hypothetical protein
MTQHGMKAFMHELIWVGNTLLPRGTVFLVVFLLAALLIGVFVWLI